MKAKLLVVELWGLGDLVIATPFLQAASRKFDVTLLAKPYALDLQPRFWPDVRVRTFVAPWTAFYHKYQLWRWPWREIMKLGNLRKEGFEVGLSARWDPRDHVLLWASGARTRAGFSRMGSHVFLNLALQRPDPTAHRYDHWRAIASKLDLELPSRQQTFPTTRRAHAGVLIHSGAGQPVRVWPLERYKNMVNRLRAEGYNVLVACDPDQRAWWEHAGEKSLQVPNSVSELMGMIDRSGAFIGNDSGPSHLAAACGLPTLTLFGPQLPDWFAPMGSSSQFIEGKACPYKPCSDYCRFTVALCMAWMTEDEAFARALSFVQQALRSPTLR